jgi:tetrahydromethanopterin S-methyltransferase subunit C
MIDLIAITTNQVQWWVALVVGLVVAGVVTALLETLRQTVVQVNEAVAELWNMGTRLAQNTSATHVLDTTKARGIELGEEFERHPPAERSHP